MLNYECTFHNENGIEYKGCLIDVIENSTKVRTPNYPKTLSTYVSTLFAVIITNDGELKKINIDNVYDIIVKVK